ncbi:hypothetical protein [Methanosarcina barkeri]|uniref:hypothetical protein n=1 Tax=Methanosarcina barkeri TaxID=2208 RepID=UPI0012D3D3B4|nr:hypothetical protein [Methanosarcina barkeri]
MLDIMRQKVIVHNLRFAICLDKTHLIIKESVDFRARVSVIWNKVNLYTREENHIFAVSFSI